MSTEIIFNDVEALFNKIVQHPRSQWRSMLDLECVGRPPEFRTAVEQLLDADIEASNKSNFLVPVAEIRVVNHIKAALETLQKGLAPTVDWRRLEPRKPVEILPPEQSSRVTTPSRR